MITADIVYAKRKEAIKEIQRISNFIRMFPEDKNIDSLKKFLDLKTKELEKNMLEWTKK